jgi:hypothetical protein
MIIFVYVFFVTEIGIIPNRGISVDFEILVPSCEFTIRSRDKIVLIPIFIKDIPIPVILGRKEANLSPSLPKGSASGMPVYADTIPPLSSPCCNLAAPADEICMAELPFPSEERNWRQPGGFLERFPLLRARIVHAWS